MRLNEDLNRAQLPIHIGWSIKACWLHKPRIRVYKRAQNEVEWIEKSKTFRPIICSGTVATRF